MTIVAEGLSFGYGSGPPVLDHVSIEAPSGAVTAVVGPNGAGKSTLLRLLAGVRSPWSGRVMLGGEAIGAISARRRAARLALVAQRPTVAGPFSVEQVIAFGRYALPPDRAAIESAMRLFELADHRDRSVHELSVGQQQRVAMARAIAQLGPEAPPAAGARALLADEPIAAMDPRHAALTMRRLRELSRRDVAVLVVLHDLSMALNWSDRAVLLGPGGVDAAGPTEDILTPQRLEAVFGAPFIRIEGDGARALAVADAPADATG